jgi:hypothetical protein
MTLRAMAKPVLTAMILLVAAMLAAKADGFVIFAGADGTALWSANEAYVFVLTRHIGHRVSYLRFPWFLVKNYLGGIEDPDDDSRSLSVIRVTPSVVERHTVAIGNREPGSEPKSYAPRKGRIYVNYPALGGLCFWAADHFEAAAQEERRGFYGQGLTEKDFDTGWSERTFGVAPGSASSTFSVRVGESLELSVNSHTTLMGAGTISIKVLRPGKNPEVEWDHVTHWGIVGRTEYQSIFHEGAGLNNPVAR